MDKADKRTWMRQVQRAKTVIRREFGMKESDDRSVGSACAKKLGLWSENLGHMTAKRMIWAYWNRDDPQAVPAALSGENIKQVKPIPKRKPYAKWKNDGFYLSDDWRKLRYKALQVTGAICQCCGATAITSGRPLHVDHVKPRSKYPELQLEISNLQVLCEDCNLGKGAWDETDWRVIAAQHLKSIQ